VSLFLFRHGVTPGLHFQRMQTKQTGSLPVLWASLF